MKNLTIILVLVTLFFAVACSVEEPERNPNLVSKWELFETLQSDGNRKVYKPVKSTETIEFLVDLKIKRSTSWCSQSEVTLGNYFPEEKKISVSCGEGTVNLEYAIKGDFLFVYPNCEDECALKYRRIDNLVGFVN